MVVASSLTSCVSQKKMLYFQNETMLNDSTFTSIEYENERHFDYKVQPGDILYIKIASLDEKFSTYFNSVMGSNNNTSENSVTDPNTEESATTEEQNSEEDFDYSDFEVEEEGNEE